MRGALRTGHRVVGATRGVGNAPAVALILACMAHKTLCVCVCASCKDWLNFHDATLHLCKAACYPTNYHVHKQDLTSGAGTLAALAGFAASTRRAALAAVKSTSQQVGFTASKTWVAVAVACKSHRCAHAGAFTVCVGGICSGSSSCCRGIPDPTDQRAPCTDTHRLCTRRPRRPCDTRWFGSRCTCSWCCPPDTWPPNLRSRLCRRCRSRCTRMCLRARGPSGVAFLPGDTTRYIGAPPAY